MTLACRIFHLRQTRVISLNSWYLTSLINLSFCRFDDPLISPSILKRDFPFWLQYTTGDSIFQLGIATKFSVLKLYETQKMSLEHGFSLTPGNLLCYTKYVGCLFGHPFLSPFASRINRISFPNKLCVIADNIGADRYLCKERNQHESNRNCPKNRWPWPCRHPQGDPPHHAHPRGWPTSDIIDTTLGDVHRANLTGKVVQTTKEVGVDLL